MIVELEPWEYIHAHDIGIKRAVANWNVNDKKSYTIGLNQPEIIASPASAICELAVAKALNMYWGGHVWDNRDHKHYNAKTRDLEGIEVRRIRERGNPFSIWPKDAGKNVNIVVAYAELPEFREVEILGWIPASIAWERGTEKYGRRVLSTSHLKPIETYGEVKENAGL